MVISSRTHNGSLYCNEDEHVLIGESVQIHNQHYDTPSKAFYAIGTASHNDKDAHFARWSNERTILKNKNAEDEEGCRSRANTFDSQNDSLPSTSSLSPSTSTSYVSTGYINSKNSSSLPGTSCTTTRRFNKAKNRKKMLEEGEIEVDERLEHEYYKAKEIAEEEEFEDEEMDEAMLEAVAAEEAEMAAAAGDDGTGNDINGAGIEKRHKCNICGKAFPYMSILESHKRCHTGEKPFSCHFCDKKFAQKATLQVHERTHTGERPYKCKYCEKTFAQYGTKTVHEKSAHLGIRNYKCPKCNKFLSSPSALYTHKKTHGDKSFQCIFCPKQFTLKNYLKLHIKQVHEHGERKHICKFCSKTFAYAGSLQVHVRTHTGERPYICKFCPKAFASQGNLQSHERTHTGERPYICRHCSRSFIQKSQLTAHEATHIYGECVPDDTDDIMNEEMDACDQAYVLNFIENNNSNDTLVPSKRMTTTITSTNMTAMTEKCSVAPRVSYSHITSDDLKHFNGETGQENNATSPVTVNFDGINTTSDELQHYGGGKDRKQNDFVCKFCGKRYAYASSLYVHTRLHTGERPFRCNFCDKSFTNQGNMQVHLRVHTGEKPYKCEACGKSYAQKVGLKIHYEQCQIYLNRRGSVMTVDSESSPPSASSLNDSMDAASLESERFLLERILCDEKRLAANEMRKLIPLNANQIQQQLQPQIQQRKLIYGNDNCKEHITDIQRQSSESSINAIDIPSTASLCTTANSAAAVAQLLELRNYDVQTGKSAVCLDQQQQQQSQLTYNSTTTNIPFSQTVASLQPILSQNQRQSPVATMTNAVTTLVPSAATVPNTIDILLQQQTQQQQSIANLLLEFEQQQQQQQEFQQLSTLKTLLDLSTVAATSANDQLQIHMIPAINSQPQSNLLQRQNHLQQLSSAISTATTSATLLNLNQSNISSLLLPQPQPQYVQQQQSDQLLQKLFQIRLYEQHQQQQHILASMQQLLPLINNGSAIINDSNNNILIPNNNNIDTRVLNQIMTTNPSTAPTQIAAASIASPITVEAPYSHISGYDIFQNKLSDDSNNNNRSNSPINGSILNSNVNNNTRYISVNCKQLMSAAVSSESKSTIIAAVEALQSLSKQQKQQQIPPTSATPVSS